VGRGFLVAAVTALVLSTAGVAARPAAQSPSAFIGPYTGVGTGGVDRTLHHDNKNPDPNNHVSFNSDDSYRGRFVYSFRIANNVVHGTGEGSYQSATWHLQGVNGSDGSFSCDPVVTTNGFTVEIFGVVVGRTMFLRFFTLDAREDNADYDCGASFTGYASHTTYLADSLDKVLDAQGGAIKTDMKAPTIGTLRYSTTSQTDTDVRTYEASWNITIKPPSSFPAGSGSGPAANGPTGPAGKAASVCTVKGTRRADVLYGTARNDVICGFGGNDRIYGLGGNDIVFGGAGNDQIDGGAGSDFLFGNAGKDVFSARDGEIDRADGGPGRDRGRFDKMLDRVVGVETKTY
jgi:Ca2+-binding RTX toxin-like protein